MSVLLAVRLVPLFVCIPPLWSYHTHASFRVTYTHGRLFAAGMVLCFLFYVLLVAMPRTNNQCTCSPVCCQGVFATVCLPVLFTLCTVVTYAWINAGPGEDSISADGHQARPGEACGAGGGEFGESGGACNAADSDPVIGGSGGFAAAAEYERDDEEACGRLRLEELAVAALSRAAEAVWALASRVLRPEAGDAAAAAVSTISLCSVAFFAVPTFLALEDAERTYQVCVCALCVRVAARVVARVSERDRRADGEGELRAEQVRCKHA